MSTEMPDRWGDTCSVLTSCEGVARRGMEGEPAGAGGGPLRRSRSPIRYLLAAKQPAQERTARAISAARPGHETHEPLDVLGEPRAGRRVPEEQAAVDGVDDRDEVVGDRVRDPDLERIGDDLERDLGRLLVAVEDEL